MLLRKIRIGSRLALGFGAILAMMVAVALGAVLLNKMNQDHLTSTIAAASAKEQLAIEMKLVALEQSSAMRNLVLVPDQKAMAAINDRIKSLQESFDAARSRLNSLELSPAEREVIASIAKIDAEFDAPVKEAYEFAIHFRTEDTGNLLLRTIDPLVQRQLAELDTLVQQQRGAYQEAMESSLVRGARLTWIAIALVAGTLVIAAMFAWALTRSISEPLKDSLKVARRVAAGDLTSSIKVEGRDEAAELLTALRDMNQGLGGIVTQIRTGAESIAVGAGEVAAGNQQLSSRTEEHASSLQQTASTLEQFTTTVRQNADHAKQASALAGSASATAERGGEVVSKVVATMKEVSSSSKKISDIIGVIDGISFQTNILALNAAVEAARAGEQGRGFAVVASEVRSLAQRSAASAKEIRGLIEGSVGRVEAGARLVEQAGKTMDELVASVRKVAEIMNEIASASDQQSSGIEQINRAITQMDTVVQMNASLVEQATAAATSMASQATGLARSVAQFRVEGSAPDAAVPLTHAPEGRRIALGEGQKKGAAERRTQPALAAGEQEDWKEF
ncbi:MAG TPA: methyl-accepting chemotaxis protein [Usitatibacter sp.]|nr:methyl-accepting chemotaxis protein [Usitatibacter sp.]